MNQPPQGPPECAAGDAVSDDVAALWHGAPRARLGALLPPRRAVPGVGGGRRVRQGHGVRAHGRGRVRVRGVFFLKNYFSLSCIHLPVAVPPFAVQWESVFVSLCPSPHNLCNIAICHATRPVSRRAARFPSAPIQLDSGFGRGVMPTSLNFFPSHRLSPLTKHPRTTTYNHHIKKHISKNQKPVTKTKT
jgi:hypothetical protein